MYKLKRVSGAGLGSKIGFPTINCEAEYGIREEYGVYAGYIIKNSHNVPCVIHWGPKPTLREPNPLVEIHVLTDEQITDNFVSVVFINRLRDIRRFNTISELHTQIKKDIKKAKSMLNILSNPKLPKDK